MQKITDNEKPAVTKHNLLPHTRSTIGLLIGGAEEPLSWATWMGVEAVAQERDSNLICFIGGWVRPPGEPGAEANVIYDLVSPEVLDGLVIWGGGLAQYVGPEKISALCEQYRPLPMISAALPLEGIPSILVDNYYGMYDAMLHLTKVHNYRRIAFIRGPKGHPEAEERYRAYTDVLAECGLSFDAGLVAPGEFSHSSGVEAIALWIDQQKLRPQIDFEAIVAVDDVTAFGAIEALRARGIHVPGDVAVLGFDDIAEARAITPPLTTVRQPIYDQGRQAAEMLLALMAGGQVPAQVTPPAGLVVRQSCGCLSPAVSQAAVGPVTKTGAGFATALAAWREGTLDQTTTARIPGIVSEKVERLVNAFSDELMEESPGIFLLTLSEILHQVLMESGEVISWQDMLSSMRRYTLPFLLDKGILSRAEDLLQQGRVMIGEAVCRGQIHRMLLSEQRATTLHEIGQALGTTLTVAGLVNELADELPRLDIPSFYLSLYEGQAMPPEISRLILALDENGRIELETGGRRFLSHRLAPAEILPRERRYSMMAMPLYFGKEQLGFALFEVGPREGEIYDTLRGQVSSALRGALLLQERKQAEDALEKAYVEVEEKVKEQTAELKLEIAERERAQAQSLQLQQEVIETQKQALQELSTPVIPVMDRIIVMPLIGSIDSMRARSITRSLLAGIREHRAKVVILDITGVPLVDSGVASHLNKTIQAARLKGARTIVTGIADAVAETIVDLGIDWSGIDTLNDLQTGLVVALNSLGVRLTSVENR